MMGANIDYAIVISSHYQEEKQHMPHKEAIIHALDMAKEGDIVLLAGKGHENYQITKDGKVPFSEEQIVKDYYDLTTGLLDGSIVGAYEETGFRKGDVARLGMENLHEVLMRMKEKEGI